jgi:hypothetical protein
MNFNFFGREGIGLNQGSYFWDPTLAACIGWRNEGWNSENLSNDSARPVHIPRRRLEHIA